MNIFVADDECNALRMLKSEIEKIRTDANVLAFQKPRELLECARNTPCEIAFLDMDMGSMNGLDLAQALKDINPKVNIIFVTGYPEYALDAHGLYVSGFLVKPAGEQDVKQALDNLRHPIKDDNKSSKLYIQCFGNFEVFFGDEPLHFKLSRSKELLAYLVDRQGAVCTIGELVAVLWEDQCDTQAKRSQLRNLIADLRATLKIIGADDVVIKRRGSLFLNREHIICDYYDFLQAIPAAVNKYNGEYMVQYSWAEMTTASLFWH